MELQTIITLLAIIVTLLSVVMIGLLSVALLILFKIHSMLRRIDILLNNITKVSEWIEPAKALSAIMKLVRR